MSLIVLSAINVPPLNRGEKAISVKEFFLLSFIR